MKNSIKILITGLFALSAAYGQEKGIKLINVYEKSFNEPIVDVIFDTATVSLEEAKAMGWKEEAFTLSEKAKGEVTIPYPCVLITKKKVSFLDKKGKEKKSIKMLVEGVKWEGKEGVHIGKGRINVRKSKNGEYLALAIPREGSNLGEGEKGDLAIYRKDGNEMWRLKNVYLSDGYIIPSPNGEYAITLPPGEYPEYPPLFYSKEGVKELTPRGWQGKWRSPFCPETPIFSDNGKYFAIPIVSFRDDSSFLLLSTSFNQVWFKTLEGKINKVRISNTGKYIVASSGNTTVCFDKKGKTLWKKKTSPSIFSFNKEENLLLLTYSRKGKIEAVDPTTGITKWIFEDKALIKKSTLIEVNIRKATILIFGKFWQYLPPKGSECVYILSTDGRVLFKKFLESNLLTKTYFDSEGENKGINFSPDRKFIIFSPYTGKIRITKNFPIGGEK